MILNRTYKKDDYNKIINFLREIYIETNKQHCWLPQRWEYAEYNSNTIDLSKGWKDWKEFIRIWEEDNKIVAIAHKESGFEVFLQIRPKYEFLALEMINYLEKTIPNGKKNENCELWLYVNNTKKFIEPILKDRGYSKNSECCYYNYQDLNKDYSPKLPEGYSFADGNDVKNKEARKLCCHLGFHPDDEPNTLPLGDFTMEDAPLFNPKFEIMTKDTKGNLCSFCIIWYDEILNIGMLEPVCTRLAYRRKGLGTAMITEGLRRLKKIGAKKVYVESYGNSRKSFYQSLGFTTYDSDYPWKKKFLN